MLHLSWLFSVGTTFFIAFSSAAHAGGPGSQSTSWVGFAERPWRACYSSGLKWTALTLLYGVVLKPRRGVCAIQRHGGHIHPTVVTYTTTHRNMVTVTGVPLPGLTVNPTQGTLSLSLVHRCRRPRCQPHSTLKIVHRSTVCCHTFSIYLQEKNDQQ